MVASPAIVRIRLLSSGAMRYPAKSDFPCILHLIAQIRTAPLTSHQAICSLSGYLDEWEIKPGEQWIKKLSQIINKIKSAAVFIGKDNVGPWQEQEIFAFLNEFFKNQLPIIPVTLPTCNSIPKFPVFLNNFNQVDFRNDIPDPLIRLIHGITGIRPSIPE